MIAFSDMYVCTVSIFFNECMNDSIHDHHPDLMKVFVLYRISFCVHNFDIKIKQIIHNLHYHLS